VAGLFFIFIKITVKIYNIKNIIIFNIHNNCFFKFINYIINNINYNKNNNIYNKNDNIFNIHTINYNKNNNIYNTNNTLFYMNI
jgi:hypothetical protein